MPIHCVILFLAKLQKYAVSAITHVIRGADSTFRAALAERVPDVQGDGTRRTARPWDHR